jgi:hypothetical protein
MRLMTIVLATLLFAAAAPAEARVQPDLVRWVPDCEFPVDCDEED